MFVIKNKDGLLMKLTLFPATPPWTATFHPEVTLDMAEKYETEEDAHAEVKWLIEDQLDPPGKFEGYILQRIGGNENE